MIVLTVTTPEIVGAVAAIVGVAVGPGGVFFILFKKGLNGSLDAIKRMEKSVDEIKDVQQIDHDHLTRALGTLEDLTRLAGRNQRKIENHSEAIEGIRVRCDVLHREWGKTGGTDPK